MYMCIIIIYMCVIIQVITTVLPTASSLVTMETVSLLLAGVMGIVTVQIAAIKHIVVV